MGGMDLGNEKQMSMNVATKVILHFFDLVSAKKSVKKRTQFFSNCKMGTRSSKFVFYGIHIERECLAVLLLLSLAVKKKEIFISLDLKILVQ